MREQYYSQRNKIGPEIQVSLEMLFRLFLCLYKKYHKNGYFQEYFGYSCANGDTFGLLGEDIEAIIFLKLHKEDLWPIEDKITKYSEEDLFDIIEFMYDHCSKPLEGVYHSFYNCGYHYNTFDRQAGQVEFRLELNDILRKYKNGYEISITGELIRLVDDGFDNLFKEAVPTENRDIHKKIEYAKLKFLHHKSTQQDKKEAIRELADVLELLRPQAALMKNDDSTLFNIINNFGIRHCNQRQKENYNKLIWHPWMFYFFLATIYAILRFINVNNTNLV